MDIIQQWQYVGNVHPALLTDQAFENCRDAGITSVQSYVTWAEIEKQEGTPDFSAYDPLVEKLFQHNLKWVPFLILGPHYATPKWFQQSPFSVYAKCLEHNRESKIQSIWNPHLPHYVERFLKRFSEHYDVPTLFESITLGISGNWGEAIYPATGCFVGGFHVHPGWWCGDTHARDSFCIYATDKYGSLSVLNDCWGTDFKDHIDITFPRTGSPWHSLYYRAVTGMPEGLKPLLKKYRNRLRDVGGCSIRQILKILHPSSDRERPETFQHRIDFVDWYSNSMTKWAGFWLKAARALFPSNDIYLVTGGKGEPVLGADLSAQTRVAAKYNAGIRITNQNDDYAESTILTRLVSAASRNYGTYFTTEEAGVNSAGGVTMRLFDAVTSGAKGVYFKNIIGTGPDVCGEKDLPPGYPAKGAENLQKNLKYAILSNPVLEIAVFYPNTSIAITPSTMDALYDQCFKLRVFLDFDLMDENMIADKKLLNYGFLVILAGKWLRKDTFHHIMKWVSGGGVLISASYQPLTTLNTHSDKGTHLFSSEETIRQIGSGHAVWLKGKGGDRLRQIPHLILNRTKAYPWKPIPDMVPFRKGYFFTRFPRHILYFDPVRYEIHLQNLDVRRSEPKV
ncbi:MAG: beta-galactosidase [Deltaproteobacteria bacterium]|nr:beta-galactosidase [Deltaproteobacteria bacterium]